MVLLSALISTGRKPAECSHRGDTCVGARGPHLFDRVQMDDTKVWCNDFGSGFGAHGGVNTVSQGFSPEEVIFTLSAGTHQDDLEHHRKIVSPNIETQVDNWVYTAPQTKVFSAQTSDVVIFRRRSRCGPCTWISGFAEQESSVQRSLFSAPPRDRSTR